MCMVGLDFIFDSPNTLDYIAEEAEIQDLTPLDDSNQSLLSFVGFRDNGESTDHVSSDMKSKVL